MCAQADGELTSEVLGLADELVSGVTRLRRVLRRAARRGWPYEPLPRNQIELLRLAGERPGIGVATAAAALGLAPNTVSTLVNELRLAGLLTRESDSGDRRVAHLSLTAEAVSRLAAWRDRRAELLAIALAELSAPERAALAVGLPTLEGLIERLEQPEP